MKLSAKQACQSPIDFSQLNSSPEGLLGWIETGQHTGGRARLMFCNPNTDPIQIRPLSPEALSLGTRVHEYGGRCWCFGNDGVFFVAQHNQQLFFQGLHPAQPARQITDLENSRFLEPCFDGKHCQIIAVEEYHTPDHSVINRLVSIDPETGTLSVLHQGCDFYASLALAPENDQIAWISWNHPNQPWTSTQLYVANLGRNQLTGTQILAGSDTAPEALQMPQFSADNTLWVITDRSGYWNLYSYDTEQAEWVNEQPEPFDLISSPWQSGNRQYTFTANSEPLCLQFRPEQISLRQGHQGRDLAPFNHIREVARCGSMLCALVAGSESPLTIVGLNLNCDEIKTIRGQDDLPLKKVSQPELISFNVDTDLVHGYYYPSLMGVNQPPPLILMLHGGPTSSTYPIYNPQIQYWCQRGFSILDLNYRGSSNLGRDYRLKLRGQWGVAEVEDINTAIKTLIKQGKADPLKLFIRGRSSGGFSALMALCSGLAFRGATSCFGVTDPLSLRASTHKFESHYLDWLLGSVEDHPEVYQQRSPLARADDINTPMLLLQGRRDPVVTPDQTERLHRSLEQRGIPVKVHYFEDEGHGFRKAENQIHALELEYAFYKSLLTPDHKSPDKEPY